MADLEEMGYLIQPHTSAGRIPSDEGYRFYVNSLMRKYKIGMEAVAQLQSVLETRVSQLEKRMHSRQQVAVACCAMNTGCPRMGVCLPSFAINDGADCHANGNAYCCNKNCKKQGDEYRH